MKGDDPVHKTGFNHYSDGCLYQAGGRNKGVMDFIQFHTYPWAGESYLCVLCMIKEHSRQLGYRRPLDGERSNRLRYGPTYTGWGVSC